MSETVVLKADVREGVGKEKAKRLRKEGFIPAVFYSKKDKTASLKVNELELVQALKKGEQIIELHIGRKKRKGLIKEIQFHPVTEKIVHIDFQSVSMSEVVTVDVPLKLIGTPEGVREGGVMEVNMYSVEVKCKVSEIPHELELNVADLMINDSVHVKDLSYDGVDIVSNEENLVVTIISPLKAAASTEAKEIESEEVEDEGEIEEGDEEKAEEEAEEQ